MPVVTPSTNPSDGQVNLTSKPASTQLTLNQMIGEVLQWNPDVPHMMAKRWLQNSYRKVIDERLWYGLMVKGQISVPNQYNTGTVSVINGNDVVTGAGTAWDNSLIGHSFRIGFGKSNYRVKSVESATLLTLDLKWGHETLSTVGYSLFRSVVSLGSNIKMVLECLNTREGIRMYVNLPQAVLNEYDVWRSQMGFTYCLASYPPSASGEPQYELYPAPTTIQAFPYIAYVQPPDFANGDDYPVTFVRSDVVVLDAVGEALLFRGKNSKYYDPTTSALKKAEFKMQVENLKKNDDNHYMKDLVWQYGSQPFSRHGADWTQAHAGDD